MAVPLSWLTGSLDSDAGDYININFNNVKRLQESQGKLIKVLNHTNHRAYGNSAKITNIQESLESLKLDIKMKSDKSNLIDRVLATYNDFDISIQMFVSYARLFVMK